MVMNFRERFYRFRSFWIFPLIALVLLKLSYDADRQNRLTALLWLMPLGILTWTLLEYGLHRFVFHIQIPLRNPRLRDFVNASHLSHHVSPRDPGKVLVHPSFG